MIKIVRIIARLNIGGPAINAVLLTEGLDKDKFITCLVAGKIDPSEGDMSYLAKEKNIDFILINELCRNINIIKDLKAFWKIYKIIKKEKPDIVHTHTAKAGTLGRLAAFLARVPIRVHTFHGHVFDGYFNSIATRVFVGVEKALGRITTRVITVSNSVANDVSMRYNIVPKEKVAVILLGFDLDRFLTADSRKGRLKQELDLANDCFLVGIVGRLVPIKNHKMFFDAIKILVANGIKVKALIVGDGQLRRELESYTEQIKIKNNILFLGWRKDLENIYPDLDVVCLTSLNEGTPVSLIEAMACGKPVVATNVGGVKDVVDEGKSGFLAPPGDVNCFADLLSGLLKNDAKRSAMGVYGRNSVMAKFTKERLVKDTKGLYENLLKERKG